MKTKNMYIYFKDKKQIFGILINLLTKQNPIYLLLVCIKLDYLKKWYFFDYSQINKLVLFTEV